MPQHDQQDFLTDLEYPSDTYPFDKRKYKIWLGALGFTIAANLYLSYQFRLSLVEGSGLESEEKPFELMMSLFLILAVPLTAMLLSGLVSFITYRAYPYRGRYFPVAIIIAVVLESICMFLFYASYSDLFLQ